jgi:hypothetical protein
MGIMVEMQAKDGHKVFELNRRRAIRQRCLNCNGWSWKEVENCKLSDCELFPFRSGQGKQNAKQRAKAIRSYCSWCIATEQPSRCVVMDCPLWCYRKSAVERPKTPLYEAIQERMAVNE